MVTRYTNLPDNKDKPFGGAYSVYDVETVECRNMIIEDLSWHERSPDDVRKEFLSTYMEWMPSTHNLIGIEKFTLIVGKNSNITSWKDLEDKNIGTLNTNSGSYLSLKNLNHRL